MSTLTSFTLASGLSTASQDSGPVEENDSLLERGVAAPSLGDRTGGLIAAPTSGAAEGNSAFVAKGAFVTGCDPTREAGKEGLLALLDALALDSTSDSAKNSDSGGV